MYSEYHSIYWAKGVTNPPNRGIYADVIVYIFARLHTTLRTKENLLGVYRLQAARASET